MGRFDANLYLFFARIGSESYFVARSCDYYANRYIECGFAPLRVSVWGAVHPLIAYLLQIGNVLSVGAAFVSFTRRLAGMSFRRLLNRSSPSRLTFEAICTPAFDEVLCYGELVFEEIARSTECLDF
jgi:hypothetical protein